MTDAKAGPVWPEPPKNRFDTNERTRLRATLLAYMEQHGIGTPTLLNRIAEKSRHPPHLLPLKTLQRFLGAQGRTNDGFLIPCDQFARTLPEANPAAELGEAFDRYFGLGSAAIAQTAGRDRDAGLAAAYSVYTKPSAKLAHLKLSGQSLAEEYSVLYAKCVIKRTSPRGPLLIREELYDPFSLGPAQTGGQLRRNFEGIVAFFDPLIFILAKDTATRLPKGYWLRESAQGLFGQCMEETLQTMTGAPGPFVLPNRFRFERLPPEDNE